MVPHPPFLHAKTCVPRLLSLSTVILRSEDSAGIAGRERKTKTRLLAALSNPFPALVSPRMAVPLLPA